ncbi:DUF1707 domain-containing protein [Streptomyces sp. NPDC058145]|uniref:DUF1707 domain-containing protein n=1 Tax=Streptomyces sp. NPDC058145 TaxID=3346356 RepID=UPI0036F1586A
MDSPQPSEESRDDSSKSKSLSPRPGLRASDADRERAAAVLQEATADGRISPDELEQRLEVVYSAGSRSELDAVVEDLQPVQWARRTPSVGKDTGVLSDFVRKGRWTVGDSYRGTAVVGSGVIDLREAEFTGPETTIHVSSWIGTVYIVVPDDVEVHVEGTGVLGGFKQDRVNTGYSARHRVHVTGLAVCGTVSVVHQLTPALERRLLKRRRKGIAD